MLIKIKNRKIYNDAIDIYLKKILILNLDIELCWYSKYEVVFFFTRKKILIFKKKKIYFFCSINIL